MFTVNDDLSIYLTRGDTLFFNVTAKDHGNPYTFKPGDVIRISVTAKKDVTDVYIQKDFLVNEACRSVFIFLEGRETKIGEKINKYKDYWYEIVLNPDTIPQTIIGNNDEGPKILRLFPEADDVAEDDIQPDEIPVVDAELDINSGRPVSNRVVAAAIARLTAAISELRGNTPNLVDPDGSVFNALGQVEGLSLIAIDAYGVAVKNGFNGSVEEWLESLKGEKGDPGNFEELTEAQKEFLKGKDGISVEHYWNGTTLTIKSASGTSSVNLKGQPGTNGRTPVKGVDYFDGVDGRGIASIVRTSGNGTAGTTDTYTIRYTDNSTSTFTVRNGANGSNGNPGRGISSVSRTTGNGAAGTTDTYTITFTDGTTKTFTVRNGANGTNGVNGATFTPYVNASGDLSWSNDKGLTNPGTVNIKGIKGNDGRGIVSIARTAGNGAAGTVDTYTITYTDATTSQFTVYNGANGTGGSGSGGTGEDGATFTPYVDANGNLSWSNDKGLANPATVNIKGAPGTTPQKGTDYWTANDKAQMVSDVIAALPVYNGEAVSV